MIPGNGYCRVAVNFNLQNGQLGQNIFDFAYDVSAPGDADELLQGLNTFFTTAYNNLLSDISTAVSMDTLTVWDINPVDGDLTLIGEEPMTWTGSGGNDPLPAGVAKLIRLYTEDPDIIGRKYLPGFTEFQSGTAGLFTDGSALADTLAFAVAVTTALQTGNIQLAPGVFSMTKLLFSAFTGENFNPSNPAYQRRRRQNVGA